MATALAGPVNASGSSNRFRIHPSPRRESVGEDSVSVINVGVVGFGRLADPGDLWLLDLQSTALPTGGVSQTAEGVFTWTCSGRCPCVIVDVGEQAHDDFR